MQKATAHSLVQANLGAQRQSVEEELAREWRWPSPESGFALYVWSSCQRTPPFLKPEDLAALPSTFEDVGRWDYASALAAAGYAASAGLLPPHLFERWQQGFERLRGRPPFPADRHSFAFRPLELLGICLGVGEVPGASDAARSWLAQVLRDGEAKLAPWSFWSRSLGALAAAQAGVTWRAAESALFNTERAEDWALLYWMRTVAPELAFLKSGLPSPDAVEEHLVGFFSAHASASVDAPHRATLLFALVQICDLAASQWRKPTSSMHTISSSLSHTQHDLKGQVDFAIVSIREDEFEAVQHRFPKEFFYRGPNRLYAMHRLPLGGGQFYSVATVRTSAQGGGTAQKATSDIIHDLQPRFIVLVGIGGGVPSAEWTLGDVVVATQLQDFSVQARKQGGATEYAQMGGPMHPEVQNVLAMLPAMSGDLGDWNTPEAISLAQPPVELEPENFYGSSQWQESVRNSLARHFPDSASARPPLVTARAIASSDALIKDADLIEQWLHSARHTSAVEMELAGAYHAARTVGQEYPILAIRGISDIVGFKRRDDWTAYACHSAASFARALISTGLLGDPVPKTPSCWQGG